MTPKQEAFVREYLAEPSLNATAAYQKAGYKARGHAAETGAERLMRNAEVQAAIAEAMKARGERTKIDADWLLLRLAEEAEADIADIYDDEGSLKPVRDWPKVWRTGLVSGIETTVERDGEDAEGNPVYVTVRKVKLADRTKIKELVGKHVAVGAFKELIKVEGELSFSERLRRAEERVK